MYSKADSITIARHYIAQAKLQGAFITKAILFGSYAADKPHKDSDIDLCLVAQNFTKNIITNAKYTALASYNFPDIEVHHFNTDYFEKGDPFIDEIKRTGIELELE